MGCVTSTQKVAREHALTDRAGGMIIVADTQTQGRGRDGRKWHSQEGGLYMTAILKPVRVNLIPLLAGVAVAEAIEALAGIKSWLKWPNDVLIDGRKVGGVIIESGWLRGEVRFVLLGIGVNINNPLPENLPEATSLSMEVGEEIDVNRFLDHLIRRLDHHLVDLYEEPEKIIRSWRALTQTLGKQVEVIDGSGEIVQGLAVDVDLNGALILETQEGRRSVFSGRVDKQHN